jgi:hypothetical protein
MKNLIIYLMLVAVLVGCNNDLETEGISRTTYFPEFVIEGEDFYVIPEGEDFVDPGVTVLEQGEPIDFTTTFVGRYTGYTGTTIGTDPDQYFVTYNAVNRDGFAASASRTVVSVNTGDFVNSIEGVYLASTTRVTGEAYEDLLILITEVEPGVFQVSDALGGFYTDGRALGDDYLTVGLEISVNDLSSDDYSYTPDVMRLDGIPMEVSEMSIDTENKTISFRTIAGELANGDWSITLTQIQP